MRRVTLSQFLVSRQRDKNLINADLRLLIETIARACKAISTRVNKGALAEGLGTAGRENVQGESQKKLDVLSNEILLEANEWGGNLAALASEEMEVPRPIPTHYPRGEYLLLFDPLDGSSNIDVNISVGTIFSVLRCPRTPEGKYCEPNEGAFLQPGRKQVAAGFAVYGPTTGFVLTVGDGVYGFTLDRETYTFVQTHPEIRIPEDTQEFAINASNARRWEAPVKRYIDECLAGRDGRRGNRRAHADPRSAAQGAASADRRGAGIEKRSRPGHELPPEIKRPLTGPSYLLAKSLFQVPAHQLGHLEHRHLALAAKYRLQLVVGIDHAPVLLVLKAVTLDVAPDFLGHLGARHCARADHGRKRAAGGHRLHESRIRLALLAGFLRLLFRHLGFSSERNYVRMAVTFGPGFPRRRGSGDVKMPNKLSRVNDFQREIASVSLGSRISATPPTVESPA